MEKINIKKFSFALITILVLSMTLFVGCGKNEETLPPSIKKESAIKITEEHLDLKVGDNYVIVFELEDISGSIVWVSSDESVLTVNNGVICCVGAGTATVTATVNDVNDSLAVNVEPNDSFPYLKLSHSRLRLNEGDIFYTDADVYKDNKPMDIPIKWESENTQIATVDNGTITANQLGKTKIFVSAKIENTLFEDEILIEVMENVDIELIKTEMNLYSRKINEQTPTTSKINILIKENNNPVSNDKITFESENSDVATVGNDGTVTAVNKGETKIKILFTSSRDILYIETVNVFVSQPVVNIENTLECKTYNITDAYTIDVSAWEGIGSGGEVTSAFEGDTKLTGVTLTGNTLSIPKSNLTYGEKTWSFEIGKATYNANVLMITQEFTTAEQLLDFTHWIGYRKTNGTYEDAVYSCEGYYVLGNDIDLKASIVSRYSIGYNFDGTDKTIGLKGTFDGRGHKIIGGVYRQGGLFGNVSESGIIKNVKFEDSVFGGTHYSNQIIAISMYGMMDNVDIEMDLADSTLKTTGGAMALISWKTTGGIVKNCDFMVRGTRTAAVTNDVTLCGNANEVSLTGLEYSFINSTLSAGEYCLYAIQEKGLTITRS